MKRKCRPSPPCVLVAIPRPREATPPKGRDLMEGDNRPPGSTPESPRTLRDQRDRAWKCPRGVRYLKMLKRS